MASPLSRNLIAGAIGESGSIFYPAEYPLSSLSDAGQDGARFAAAAGAGTLAVLRAMTAEQLQDADRVQAEAARAGGNPLVYYRFGPTMDGYFLPKSPSAIFEAGEQARIPLLAGSNTEERPASFVLGDGGPTPEGLANAIRKFYGDRAGPVLKGYAATTTDEVYEAAAHLASARFQSWPTWKWTELHLKTGGKPIYRYLYAHPRPLRAGMPGQPGSAASTAGTSSNPAAGAQRPVAPRGASHGSEIVYAMGNLDLEKSYEWKPADYEVSKAMQAYWVNFIKTGNPNGSGLPDWPAYRAGAYYRMRIDVKCQAEPEPHRDRYLALETAMGRR
jgi:para-nitrobenzyl esterase